MEIKNKVAAVSVGAVTSLAAVTGLAAFAGAQSPDASADTTIQAESVPAEAIESPENEADEAAENAALAEQASLSAADAEAAATAAVPGTAAPAELEDEDGTVAYEVEVTDDAGTVHEVIIDANTGDVLAQEVDDDDDGADDDEGEESEADEAAENAALAEQASLSAADAEAAATAAVPGTAAPAELEDEDGTVVYEVEVTDEAGTVHEVIIDANTGDVLAQEVDDDDDDDDDDGREGTESAGEPADMPAGEAAGN
ncbi:PepSY domain-containing protein [Euzebya tangerina]|uniref:PepSY domain-containing protein n=1 Tax=Euzebya tangerina TaxID=591198 RepID=UPI000E3228A8|nr:PepSY domain-containing protein [Euzebya tangerina]